MDNKKAKAFTLAEVLITLGIIGIVAALTLPALIQKNQRKELETALKKNYSVLQSALQQASIENGSSLTCNNVGSHKFKELITKYLKVSKDCGLSSCLKYNSEYIIENYKTYNGKTMATNLFDDGQFVLNDGTLVLIENVTVSFLLVSVDVNGMYKGPNKWGHDLFTFQLMGDGKLLPMGSKGTSLSDKNQFCSIDSTQKRNGVACAYYALTDKDYWKNLP